MKNEIPYPELLSGGAVDKLYCNDGTGKVFLKKIKGEEYFSNELF